MLKIALQLPNDIHLPCFVYGFLKPGELAHDQISDFVGQHVVDAVAGQLRIWDGLPLLGLRDESSACGYLLHSNAPESLYKAIIAFEPADQYKWAEVTTQHGQLANVLLGRQKPYDNAVPIPANSFTSGEDVVLTRGLEAARIALWRAQPSYGREEYYFFDVQMSYMLISSVFERFLSLRYGPLLKPMQKVLALARDPKWAEAVTCVKSIKDLTAVYRSDSGELTKVHFDRADPEGSAKFFYQFRSNLMHRGKGAIRDVARLKDAANGFLEALQELWASYNLPWLADTTLLDDCNSGFV